VAPLFNTKYIYALRLQIFFCLGGCSWVHERDKWTYDACLLCRPPCYQSHSLPAANLTAIAGSLHWSESNISHNLMVGTAYIQAVLNIETCCVQRKKKRLRFSSHCVWRRVDWHKATSVSEDIAASTFRVVDRKNGVLCRGRKGLAGQGGYWFCAVSLGLLRLCCTSHHGIMSHARTQSLAKYSNLHFRSSLFPSFVSSPSPSFSFFHSVSVSMY
jgi:hypothetical protein